MYLVPAIVYPVLVMLLPVVFYLLKPKYAWYGIPCAVILEVIAYWRDFSYYESRGLMILFTVAQIIVMFVVLWLLKRINRKK